MKPEVVRRYRVGIGKEYGSAAVVVSHTEGTDTVDLKVSRQITGILELEELIIALRNLRAYVNAAEWDTETKE